MQVMHPLDLPGLPTMFNFKAVTLLADYAEIIESEASLAVF